MWSTRPININAGKYVITENGPVSPVLCTCTWEKGFEIKDISS
jgi:hypothetical protein